MAEQGILVLNAGSSSIKAAVFASDLRELLRCEASGIATAEGQVKGPTGSQKRQLKDHPTALAAIMDILAGAGFAEKHLTAAAHRVVHGGQHMGQSVLVTPQVREAIKAAIPLAPLHNPHHLSAIDAVSESLPQTPQIACFDTAFHRTNPDVATRYALPRTPQTETLRRYGFHGISYASLVANFTKVTGAALPGRLLALHLGNGASLCAIGDGRSLATTMGFSPLSGLTMGTRVGEIDAGAVLHLSNAMGSDAAAELLQHRSGLLGLSGLSSDMRTLSESSDPAAAFARAHFCYWIVRAAGSMIAAMGGLDGIAFTGGIGENDKMVRKTVLQQLAWAGDVPHWIIPAAEEAHIAREAIHVLGTESTA